jgi:polyhydroxyalkanoate synthesis regulator phasin
MNRKFVSTGLLAGLVAGTGAGLILQQTGLAGASNAPSAAVVDDASTTNPADTSTEDTSTEDGARPDRGERLSEVLQALVDDGTLTGDQLAAVISTLEAAGPPEGFDGPHRHGGRGHHRGLRVGLEAAATELGLTVEELRDELVDGSTIADVAAEQGVDVQAVIDAMVAEASTRLTDRVTAGELTQEEADAKLAELTTRITEVVNNGRPARPELPADEAEAEADTDTTTDTAAG